MDTVLVVAIALAAAVIAVFLTYSILRRRLERQFRSWQDEQLVLWQGERETARRQAIAQSRAVLGGKFTEQMAPYLPQFNYDPTEARFIGSPIDLVVFPGLASGNPTEIVIMEIKTGSNCQLTPQQRKIRQLIENGMVRWECLENPSTEEG
jgi:predicted Holliday junction resolvase-like endonuclease